MTPGERADPHACVRAWTALSLAYALVSERLTAELRRTCGLSIKEFEVLLRLEHDPGPGLRLRDLNRIVRLSQPAFSRLTVRLEAQGLLRRAGDPDDGRGVRVAITPAGRELLERAVPVHTACLQDVLLSRLTPSEYTLLADALNRVAEPG